MMFQPQNQPTTADKIFKFGFRVRIPQRELYTELDREVFGIPTTGNHELDKELAEELTPVTLTIANIVDLWERKVRFTLDSVDDIVRMYGYIKEHLTAWEAAIREKIWLREPPMEDLHKLDAFAGWLFTRARGRIAKKFESESLLGALDAGSVSPISIGGPDEMTTVGDQIRTSEHESFVSTLEQNLNRRHKAWNR